MKRIAVVYGGFSSEVEISIKSGKSVAGWLRNAGYDVYEVLLTKEEWCVVEESGRYIIDRNDFSCTIGSEKITFDKVFIIIHGDPGENGLLQAYFEMLDIPFIEIRVNVFPHKGSMIVWRVAEVIDLVAIFTEFLNYIREILVSPAACYVYFCHSLLRLFLRI